MRQAQIRGLKRGRQLLTTRRDDMAARSPDLAKRDLTATAANQLWVTDLTYVPTWSGVAYVCFIVDAFSRMIVGWRVATTMRTEMVLDTLEMARWSRGTHLEGLVAHSDAGSQGEINRSSQHLDHGGVRWDGTARSCCGRRRVPGDSGRRIGRCEHRCVPRGVLSLRAPCSGSSGA
jgi:transposase InsO family protein